MSVCVHIYVEFIRAEHEQPGIARVQLIHKSSLAKVKQNTDTICKQLVRMKSPTSLPVSK